MPPRNSVDDQVRWLKSRPNYTPEIGQKLYRGFESPFPRARHLLGKAIVTTFATDPRLMESASDTRSRGPPVSRNPVR